MLGKGVSVPCRGTTFLNDLGIFVNPYEKVSVPCRGTTFLNTKRRYQSPIWILVSVPCRGTTFLNKNMFITEENYNLVSVPCRGTTFLNKKMAYYSRMRHVSVPCRGTTFLNRKEMVYEQYVTRRQFPSPVGELHFLILNSKPFVISVLYEFPSPVGELHFLIVNGMLDGKLTKHVSVPCRGTTFLNKRSDISTLDVNSFRPLSGNYIS